MYAELFKKCAICVGYICVCVCTCVSLRIGRKRKVVGLYEKKNEKIICNFLLIRKNNKKLVSTTNKMKISDEEFL